MEDETCDILDLAWQSLFSDSGNQLRTSALTCAAVTCLVFVTAELSRNCSQVDKLWSIIPAVYCWIVVVDERTLVMAILSTLWSVRLTFNFARRGGYKWPPWDGDEDYRWEILRKGDIIPIINNKIVWFLFSLFFIAIYQNILLWLMVSPSAVAFLVAQSTTCQSQPLNGYDYFAALMMGVFIGVETVADNHQYAFQTEKYRRKDAGLKLEGDYSDGFCQSGIFSILRKPNYAAEQSIWISFYIFSVGSVGGRTLNTPAIIGPALIVSLFAATGPFTEHITIQKYEKYLDYKKRVPLYIPNPFSWAKNSKSKRS